MLSSDARLHCCRRHHRSRAQVSAAILRHDVISGAGDDRVGDGGEFVGVVKVARVGEGAWRRRSGVRRRLPAWNVVLRIERRVRLMLQLPLVTRQVRVEAGGR